MDSPHFELIYESILAFAEYLDGNKRNKARN